MGGNWLVEVAAGLGVVWGGGLLALAGFGLVPGTAGVLVGVVDDGTAGVGLLSWRNEKKWC